MKVATLLGWIDRVHVAIGSACGVATLIIILTLIPDILGRKLLAETIPGASDVNITLLVLLIYLGLAGAQAKRRMFRAEFLLHLMGPRTRRVITGLTLLASLAFVALIAWLTVESALSSLARMEVRPDTTRFPVWPARLAIAAGFVLLAVQLGLDALRTALALPAPFDETAPEGGPGGA